MTTDSVIRLFSRLNSNSISRHAEGCDLTGQVDVKLEEFVLEKEAQE